MSRTSRPELSIIIPVLNEEANVAQLFKVLNKLKKSLPSKTEVIFVDDGSDDLTLHLLKKTHLFFQKVIVEFSRNFGNQAAFMAGLEKARGKYVVTMDGDLQHPPTLIPKMLQLHRDGVDIVLTRRVNSTNTSLFQSFSRELFYRLMNWLSDTKIEANISDFLSMNRRALSAMIALPERRRFLRGLIQWIGFSTATLEYKVGKRYAGKSNYSVSKLITLAIRSITSFSVFPLYIAGIFGLVIFIFASILTLYVFYSVLFRGSQLDGWTSLVLVFLFISGLTSLFLGLIGTYLAAMYEEIKKRPMYIIKAVYEK